jgi:hypothetical protein
MPDQTKQDYDGRAMALGLGVLLAFDAAIVVAIMAAVGASLRDIALMLGGVVALTLAALLAVSQLLWMPWQRRYPTRPIREGAVSRSMQSFGLGRVSKFNNCLRITADEEHLHLWPFILTAPFGARRISIPWQEITDVRPAMFGYMRARLGRHRIVGPGWCLRLAADREGELASGPDDGIMKGGSDASPQSVEAS